MWMLFLLLSAALVADADKQPCPSERYQNYGQKCYLDVFNQPWNEASKPAAFAKALRVCRSIEKSSLPIVRNKIENGILRSAPNDVWIGLTWKNPAWNGSGSFEMLRSTCTEDLCWVNGSNMGSYSELMPITAEAAEQCVVLQVATGKWYMDNCTSEHDFFCEHWAEQPPQQQPSVVCNGHGVQICKCDKGFSGEECEIRNDFTRVTNRCWRFMPIDNQLSGKYHGVKEGCGRGEICVPDDLDCYEDKECPNPIGWCLPKKAP